MLPEAVIRSMRAALMALDGPVSHQVADVLAVVLEEAISVFPPSNEAAKPEAYEELKSVIELQQKSIMEFANDLAATRQRAEAAELKVLEMKRGG